MELEPATLAQVQRGRDGRMVLVEDDVLDVVRQVRDLNSSLRVRWSELGGYFVVYQVSPDGSEHLVLTAQELDGRVVARVAQIIHPSYDLVAELEANDAKREREHNHKVREQVGEIGERLFHAMRKDKGATDTAFIPDKGE